MEKLIQFALSTKFGEDIAAIMDVITATPNPTVATEILLGLYEEPEVLRTDEVLHYASDEKTNIRFNYYDRFTLNVHFSHQRIINKSAWFKKYAITDPSEETIISDKYWEEDAARSLGMTQEKFVEEHERRIYHTEVASQIRNGSMSLHDWNNYVQKCETFSHVEVTGGVML